MDTGLSRVSKINVSPVFMCRERSVALGSENGTSFGGYPQRTA